MSGMFKWLKKLFAGASSSAVVSEDKSTETEFTAEVVRVTQVLPHPNADRLEIARFEMAGIGETTYEVVIQRGSFAVGDLAAYFSVDCIVPTSHPAFNFLTSRLDGAGKTHYRLRAARLRGVYSQGLLVNLDGLKFEAEAEFGLPCAERFGVTYHRPPEPSGTGGALVPSKNDARINRNIQRHFPVYGVDSLKKVPRLFEEGEPVLITEKIHGTNFRFGWVRRSGLLGALGLYTFVVGSHRVIKTAGKGGHWYGEDIWTETASRLNLRERTKKFKGCVFYGELFGHTWSGERIQDLTYGEHPALGPSLVIFDVKTEDGWLGYSERFSLCHQIQLQHAPVVAETFYSADGVKEMAEGQSLIAPDQIREGVVVESRDGLRRKAKYVGQAYLLRKEAA